MSDYLPRVSDVLALLYPGSMAFVPEAAKEEGTRLHDAMDLIVQNRQAGYHLGLRPYENIVEREQRVRYVLQLMDEAGFAPLFTEVPRKSRYGYQGHIDVIGMMNGKRWVIDYKFAEAITESNWMQLEAYVRMVKEDKREIKTVGALIQSNKNGKVTLWKHKPNTELWSAFLSGVNVLRFQQSRRSEYHLGDIQPLMKGGNV